MLLACPFAAGEFCGDRSLSNSRGHDRSLVSVV